MKNPLFPVAFWFAAVLAIAVVSEIAGAQEREKPAAEAALAKERRELAEIRLLVGADRKYAAAKERLAKLKVSLAGRADAKDLLTEATTLEQEVLRALGEAVPDQKAQDRVDEAVIDALYDGRIGFIQQLGTRAAPGLIAAVRESPDELPELEQDAFYRLLICDPVQANELCRELLGQDGFFWKKRALRTLSAHVAISSIDRSLWSASERRFRGDGILKTLEKYVEDPDVGDEALRQLAILVGKGATSSVFDASIERALRSQDPVRRQAAKGAAEFGSDRRRPLFETFLREDDADLRAFAAQQLAEFKDATVLLDHAGDPDVEVRRAVANWMKETGGAVGEQREAALARLVRDDDSKVREMAWSLLGYKQNEARFIQLPPGGVSDRQTLKRYVALTQLPAEVYRDLLHAEEREKLPSIFALLDAPLCFPLLEVLARDPKATDEVARVLDATPWFDDMPGALAVVSALLERLDASNSRVRGLVSILSRTPAGLEAVATWLLQRRDAEWTNYVLVQEGAMNGRLQHIDPKLTCALMAQLYPRDANQVAGFVRQGRDWTDELSAAFLDLARDAAQPVGMRVLALRGYLVRGRPDAEFLRVAHGVLAAPGWSEELEAQQKARKETLIVESLTEDVLRPLRGEPANELILQIVREPKLAELGSFAVNELDSHAPHAGEIVKAVLERWFGKEEGQAAVNKVLLAMQYEPALEDREVLARAAPDQAYAHAALSTIGALRDPSYLPLLMEIVQGPSDFIRRLATEALFGYLDEEAVEPLLVAAAKAPNSELRDKCLAQLEKIREYQDARARWATRKVQAATRAEVVAELVEMLDAKSVEQRVQAIRGLATWEAVEVMPRLIALVSDSNKDVAAAAREALARLNTPKGE